MTVFTPIHLLPQYDKTEAIKYQNRWLNKEGITLQKVIIQQLESDFKDGFEEGVLDLKKYKFLENNFDFKGINLKELFVKNGLFSNFDFSYVSLSHIVFENVTFNSCSFVLTKFFKCEFKNCIFLTDSFYAASFEAVKLVNCSFLENTRLRNCELREVKFDDFEMRANIFFDCQFEERTRFSDFEKKLNNKGFNQKDLAEIYKALKEGYVSGDVIERSREYYFKERQAITRFNVTAWDSKLSYYLLELVAGYGVKPFRVLISAMVIFLIFTLIFVQRLGFQDGFLLSMGAFFTNGANSNFLAELNLFYNFLYVLESFFGITMLAAFITVLANLWFKER